MSYVLPIDEIKRIQAKAATESRSEPPTRAITLTADQAESVRTRIPAVRRGSGKRRAKLYGRHIFELDLADRQVAFAISRAGRRDPGRGL